MPADDGLLALMRVIAEGDRKLALRLLSASPELVKARAARGATRQSAVPFFLEAIGHSVYAGDTALHVAAAGHRVEIVERLLELGADVRARNRRGAEPLHYAADGAPGTVGWDPRTQAAVIARLLAASADPETEDKSGVTPLHRAVRTRSAAAVEALLAGGADPKRRNGRGSSPLDLAQRTTGRSGSGSPTAKAEQAKILRLLGARPANG